MRRRQFLKGLLAAPACVSGAMATVAGPTAPSVLAPLAAAATAYCDQLARKGGIMLLSLHDDGMFEDLGDEEWTNADLAERWKVMQPLFQTIGGRDALRSELRRRLWIDPRTLGEWLREVAVEYPMVIEYRGR